MMNALMNLFGKSSKIQRLEAEIVDLKVKLMQAQENLNKTNAYWKKKLYHAKNAKQV